MDERLNNLKVVLKDYVTWNSLKAIFKKHTTWWWSLLELLDVFRIFKDKEVIFKTERETKYFVKFHNNHISTINEVYIKSVYNRGLKNIANNSVVVDIGAHIGIFSVLAAKTAGNVKVYAYEPAEANYQMLLKNIKLNNFSSSIFAYNLAVYSKKDKVRIFYKPGTTEHSILFIQNKECSKEIEAVALTDIFESNGISSCDLLKIDCEGAEFDILYSTPIEIYRKIKSLVLEYHITKEEFSKTKDEKIINLKKFLENSGFNVDIEAPTLFWGLYVGSLYACK